MLVLTFASALSSLPLAAPFSLLIFLSLFGALLGCNADGERGSLAQAMTFMVAEGGDDLHDAVKLFNLPLLHEVGGTKTVDDIF